MIFLPNDYERYIASLRMYVNISIIQKGLCKKNLSQLRTLGIAEAMSSKEYKTPTDINDISNSLLGAAVIILLQRGIKLAVSFSGNNVYFINRKLYTTLLMLLVSGYKENHCEIIIQCKSDSIIIKIFGCTFQKLIPTIVNALNGYFYHDTLTDAAIIIIPANKTQLDASKSENEWGYIIDRFSPVNIYLNNINDNMN